MRTDMARFKPGPCKTRFMGPKTALLVCGQIGPKSVCSATETSLKNGLLNASSEVKWLSLEEIESALIRLCDCCGNWWLMCCLFLLTVQRTQYGAQWLSGKVLDSRPRGCQF